MYINDGNIRHKHWGQASSQLLIAKNDIVTLYIYIFNLHYIYITYVYFGVKRHPLHSKNPRDLHSCGEGVYQ